ncbi:MAG TPA: MBL fold metallo-hydrolase [Bacteroidales bacterium]|jgi:metallo-beta-lactamase family protein|nr:MBL fold metallo-hydrolase [Bacteroidales bacterium]HNR42208.1 MBL fold metallo-hydrolase [Bacteroidales bacterium]HPM19088.1 MBL fold metallo-hydrolase [Bacteroidales bacterium]
MKLKFLGAAREVTGSKVLLEPGSGKRILFDCGMFQGKGLETDAMNRDLGFDPVEIDHVILTHAHIDHSGLIPYLYKLGFRGSVICTNATRDLCSIMLADTAFIQEHDTRTFNKKRARKGLPLVTPLFTREDADDCMKLFIGVPHGMKFRIDDNLKVRFTNTGHMLGSGVANLEVRENGTIRRVACTGDIGRPSSRILKPPEAFPQADILITESTYGDRLHKDYASADDELLRTVVHTCVDKGGKLIIPSFSVGRTQELVYSFNKFFNEDRLPRVEIFVDSPLAVNATTIFSMHPECFNRETIALMQTDPDPFGFNRLNYIVRREDSKKLNDYRKPCIIISASGMMEAGRIKHHLANNISDPRNTVLIVGYCSPATLGARIAGGAREVSIHGTLYSVNAEIKKIDAFSGHGDYREMISFLECQDKKALQDMFLVHGEYETQLKYSGELKKAGFNNIHIPSMRQEYTL